MALNLHSAWPAWPAWPADTNILFSVWRLTNVDLCVPPDQAILAADEFVVSFDGNVYEVPASCGLLLAADASRDSFSVLLSPRAQSQRVLVVKMRNTSIAIHPSGEVQYIWSLHVRFLLPEHCNMSFLYLGTNICKYTKVHHVPHTVTAWYYTLPQFVTL